MLNKGVKGFTLIEMIVVVALILTLARFAVMAYTDYVVLMKRDIAKACLTEFSQVMERSFTANNSDYSVDFTPAFVIDTECSRKVDNDYDMTVQAVTSNSFTVRAVAKNNQQLSDHATCTTAAGLTLDNFNTKSPTACWDNSI